MKGKESELEGLTPVVASETDEDCMPASFHFYFILFLYGRWWKKRAREEKREEKKKKELKKKKEKGGSKVEHPRACDVAG